MHVLNQNMKFIVLIASLVPTGSNANEVNVLNNTWVPQLATDVELLKTAYKSLFALALILENRHQLVNTHETFVAIEHLAKVHGALGAPTELLVELDPKVAAGLNRALGTVDVKDLNFLCPVGKLEQVRDFFGFIKILFLAEDIKRLAVAVGRVHQRMQRAIVTIYYLQLRGCWDFGLEIFGIIECLLIKRAGRVATVKFCLIL